MNVQCDPAFYMSQLHTPWYSVEIIPWNYYGRYSVEFHVGKNMKTPWRLRRNPCGLLYGIITEHDGSPWNFRVFCPRGITVQNVVYENSIKYCTWNPI